jgi:hypothetical protein
MMMGGQNDQVLVPSSIAFPSCLVFFFFFLVFFLSFLMFVVKNQVTLELRSSTTHSGEGDKLRMGRMGKGADQEGIRRGGGGCCGFVCFLFLSGAD